MNSVRFDDAARAELLAEVAYYARQQDGLGHRFVQAVEAAIERAVRFPSAGSPGPAGTRRIMIRGFPFAIYYGREGAEIVVYAVAHHARQPGYWVDRAEPD